MAAAAGRAECGGMTGNRSDRRRTEMPTTAPVAALTFLGVLLAVIGLFVAGNIVIVVIGLLAIFGAGLLQVLGSR